MRARNVGLAAAAYLLCGGAGTPQQFDLECTGTSKGINGSEKPWSVRLVVDLKARQFCYVGCGMVSSIARIEPDRLVFKDAPPSVSSDRDEFWVSRTNGYASAVFISRRYDMYEFITGACKVAPFSGLPKNQF
jgi:hypothetical protein